MSKKILLGMSGGTDSTVAALLLKDLGYDVTGVTFRFYEKDENTEYLKDAAAACETIGVPHIIYDARKDFYLQIITYFIDEYMAGNTPVPCVVCNNHLKWPLLARIADEYGIFHIATGHYACTSEDDGFLHFTCGKDPEKDQSFFLWGLSQDIMKRIILPLGRYTKTEVRTIAGNRGLEKAAIKKDSIGVCFCPGDYHEFLKTHVAPELIKSGFFLDTHGNILGKHKGFPFYTIGQRRGLGLNLQKPIFVKEIDPIRNTIVLDELSGLYKHQMILEKINLINENKVLNNNKVICKIRYRKQATPVLVERYEKDKLLVRFLEPLESIAPGQAAAFYDGDCLLGGGIIVGAW